MYRFCKYYRFQNPIEYVNFVNYIDQRILVIIVDCVSLIDFWNVEKCLNLIDFIDSRNVKEWWLYKFKKF